MDCTVFPANATYLANALKTFVTLASMGKNMMGLVLYPVYQAQTSAMTLMKHRHGLENSLLKAGMSVIHPVRVLYSKPESTAHDRRSMSQLGLATFHTNYNDHSFYGSKVVKEGKVGPCPLLRVSDFKGFDMDVQKPGASARVEQFISLTFECRFSEMARAITNRVLAGTTPLVRYFGFTNQEFDVNSADLRTQVYNHWDESSLSPPKSRPGTETALSSDGPSLEVLAWSDGSPRFPQALVNRFAEGTSERDEMLKAKKLLEQKFPAASQPAPAQGQAARVGGVCDYSLDGNREPLDVSRVIDLPMVRAADFQVVRQGSEASKFFFTVFEVFWGIFFEAGRLPYGWQEAGSGHLKRLQRLDRQHERCLFDCSQTDEIHGVVWRIKDDLQLLSYQKELMCTCQLLRKLAIENGLSSIEVADHALKQRMLEAATPGMEATPACFRYVIQPVESQSTNVFKPVAMTPGGCPAFAWKDVGRETKGFVDLRVGFASWKLVQSFGLLDGDRADDHETVAEATPKSKKKDAPEAPAAPKKSAKSKKTAEKKDEPKILQPIPLDGDTTEKPKSEAKKPKSKAESKAKSKPKSKAESKAKSKPKSKAKSKTKSQPEKPKSKAKGKAKSKKTAKKDEKDTEEKVETEGDGEADAVGGKLYPKDKSEEIAGIAISHLRMGESVPEVKKIVVGLLRAWHQQQFADGDTSAPATAPAAVAPSTAEEGGKGDDKVGSGSAPSQPPVADQADAVDDDNEAGEEEEAEEDGCIPEVESQRNVD
eukprot:s625_g23.t1